MIAFAAILSLFMLAVIVYDLSRYIIPNWLNAALLLLYPLYVWLCPDPVAWGWGLAIAGGMLAIGVIAFMLQWMGGGDIKLLVVCCLWAGTTAALEFLVYTGLLGGLLALGLLLARQVVAWWFSRLAYPPAIPRVLTYGEPLPYGFAIAIAFVIVVWTGQIPGIEPLSALASSAG